MNEEEVMEQFAEAGWEQIFHELAEESWERFHKSYYNERVDDVLVGALIASLIKAGYRLIGLNSDGENHHLRLERMNEHSRLIMRLTHMSGDSTTAQVQGRHASLILGYGELTPDLAQVWPRFEAEAKSLYSPAWEPGVISFDADLTGKFLYAQISLLMSLDRYIAEDFVVDLKLLGTHLDALVGCLRRYLRGRLGRSDGKATAPTSAAYRRELRDSRQEAVMGQIIATMGEAGYPMIGLVSDTNCRRIRFRAQKDTVLYAVLVDLEPNRLTVQGETKNYLANTQQLLRLHEQLQKLPAGMSYRMNSVYSLRELPWTGDAEPDGDSIRTLLLEAVSQIRESLVPYKKSYSPFTQRIVKRQSQSEAG